MPRPFDPLPAHIFTTPPLTDHRVRRFCASLSPAEPIYVRVSPLPGAENSYCYWNVETVVESVGGESEHGWKLTWWNGRFIEAVHHAIWNRYGSRLDVTPPFPAGRVQTLFVPGEELVGFSAGQRVNKVTGALKQTRPITEFLAIDRDYDRLRNELVSRYAGRPCPIEETRRLDAIGAARTRAMQTMLHSESRGNDPCPCGSGRKYKKCHAV
jgi:hypothetical protein